MVMDVRICQCYHCQFLIPIKHGEELWVGLGTGNGEELKILNILNLLNSYLLSPNSLSLNHHL